MLLIELSSKFNVILLLKSKFRDLLVFLYKILKIIPIENSKPAIPKIKNDRLNRFKSEYIIPYIIEIIYSTTQIISEVNNKFKKFFFLKKIKKKINQNIIDQYKTQVTI